MKTHKIRCLLMASIISMNCSVSEAGIWDAISNAAPSGVKKTLSQLKNNADNTGALSSLFGKSAADADGYIVKYTVPKMAFSACSCRKEDGSLPPLGTFLGGTFTLQVSYPPPVDGHPQPPAGKILFAEVSTDTDILWSVPWNAWDKPIVMKGVKYTKGSVSFMPNQMGNIRPFPATATFSISDDVTRQWITISVQNYSPSDRKPDIYLVEEHMPSDLGSRDTAPHTEYLVAVQPDPVDATSMKGFQSKPPEQAEQ